MPSQAKYYNDSTSIVVRLLDMLPCKAKRYVLKWMDQHVAKTGLPMRAVMRDFAGEILLSVEEDLEDSTGVLSRIIEFGTWPSSCWKKMLDAIAEHDNMRNAEELCIWLDMH